MLDRKGVTARKEEMDELKYLRLNPSLGPILLSIKWIKRGFFRGRTSRRCSW
jgi:hypothetical protein